MALLKRDNPAAARYAREFEQLVRDLERALHRSLQVQQPTAAVRREAARLAADDLSARYARKHLRAALHAAEAEGKRLEDQLQRRQTGPDPDADADADANVNIDHLDTHAPLALHHGHFRLCSPDLFHLLEQPTDLRFGTLRFHPHPTAPARDHPAPGVTVELALNDAYFVADSTETLPYHAFRLPTAPSLQNRGILSRSPDDHGAFPAFDSWLLFTFLGHGCIKLEVPIEMCAHVYGGCLRGRENEEVTFWGFFVDDVES